MWLLYVSCAWVAGIFLGSKVGIPFERQWDGDTQMEPFIVDTMLDDMGVGEEGTKESLEIRAATKEYCITGIKGRFDIFDSEEDHYTLGDLQSLAWAFVKGYEICLNSLNKGEANDCPKSNGKPCSHSVALN